MAIVLLHFKAKCLKYKKNLIVPGCILGPNCLHFQANRIGAQGLNLVAPKHDVLGACGLAGTQVEVPNDAFTSFAL